MSLLLPKYEYDPFSTEDDQMEALSLRDRLRDWELRVPFLGDPDPFSGDNFIQAIWRRLYWSVTSLNPRIRAIRQEDYEMGHYEWLHRKDHDYDDEYQDIFEETQEL